MARTARGLARLQRDGMPRGSGSAGQRSVEALATTSSLVPAKQAAHWTGRRPQPPLSTLPFPSSPGVARLSKPLRLLFPKEQRKKTMKRIDKFSPAGAVVSHGRVAEQTDWGWGCRRAKVWGTDPVGKAELIQKVSRGTGGTSHGSGGGGISTSQSKGIISNK